MDLHHDTLLSGVGAGEGSGLGVSGTIATGGAAAGGLFFGNPMSDLDLRSIVNFFSSLSHPI
jgi:homoserine kinase